MIIISSQIPQCFNLKPRGFKGRLQHFQKFIRFGKERLSLKKKSFRRKTSSALKYGAFLDDLWKRWLLRPNLCESIHGNKMLTNCSSQQSLEISASAQCSANTLQCKKYKRIYISLFVHFFNSANDTENCVLHTELHTVNVLQCYAVLKSAEKRCMFYQSCHFFTHKQ